MLSYLQAVMGPTANFGTRQFPLGAGEHVISLFGQPAFAAKPFGVNGRPGDIYTVPAGRRLRALQMDFSAVQSWASGTEPSDFTVILSSFENDAAVDVCAFYPDMVDIKETDSYREAVYLEKNDIDRPFLAGTQPQCRISGNLSMLQPSLELYGIEGPA